MEDGGRWKVGVYNKQRDYCNRQAWQCGGRAAVSNFCFWAHQLKFLCGISYYYLHTQLAHPIRDTIREWPLTHSWRPVQPCAAIRLPENFQCEQVFSFILVNVVIDLQMQMFSTRASRRQLNLYPLTPNTPASLSKLQKTVLVFP